jgi:endonuclease YncB( thermonuclease family)
MGKKLLYSLLFSAVSTASLAKGAIMTLPIVEVYDGDTIKTYLSVLPDPLNKISVRIYGIDTPESPAKSYRKTGKLGRANCVQEAEMALKATAIVKNMVKNSDGMLYLRAADWGKFGGRIVADVYLQSKEGGNRFNIADKLVADGLAVEYYGKKKTHDWCK